MLYLVILSTAVFDYSVNEIIRHSSDHFVNTAAFYFTCPAVLIRSVTSLQQRVCGYLNRWNLIFRQFPDRQVINVNAAVTCIVYRLTYMVKAYH